MWWLYISIQHHRHSSYGWTSTMKKSFNNLCTGHASTSTLNQHRQPTLEEMIMQLDLEEKMAAKPSRMSCVNSSDILRSARNALNQYPRFSLDGKDAMYRSSFRNFDRPAKVAGERVIWCKPGVVGKLMGLEAMPIPIRPKHKMREIQRRMISASCSKPRDEVGWPMGHFM